MTISAGFLQLNRLRVIRRGHIAYDQNFHSGVNIIRGQNGSGKSTIADFIFFILGGEYDDWKGAASQCDEVQAEIETPRGKLTLKRQIGSATEPMLVFFGPMETAAKSSLEGWERFPIRRQGGRESFSQVMFRSLLIPEAQSEGAANITMHQLLRLCYSDQRTPATRLFRFEHFDTQNIREAVGDLVCGISGYEVYEIGLKLRDHQKELEETEAKLRGLQRGLPGDQRLNTPELIHAAVATLVVEQVNLQTEIENVDEHVVAGQVKEDLAERKASQTSLVKQSAELKSLEDKQSSLEFELREIADFVAFLAELTEKLIFAEATSDTIGSIEFTHCPACGEQLGAEADEGHCMVCKSQLDPEKEKSRYNHIRLDLEIQTRETGQLIRQKENELAETKSHLRLLRRVHEKNLSAYDLNYAGDNGPREAFLATRIGRLGHIEAEVDFLLRSLAVAEEISSLLAVKAALAEKIDRLKNRNEALRREAGKRRSIALSKVSAYGAAILRSDLPRQAEFMSADNLNINFQNDSISVGNLVNFAESSNVYLKNAAIFSLFLAAANDQKFFHPRFLLLDNIEDKGMEEQRSHLFQRIVVERATEVTLPYQVIYTTSMMNPELELDDYTIGPAYTNELKTLDLGYQQGLP